MDSPTSDPIDRPPNPVPYADNFADSPAKIRSVLTPTTAAQSVHRLTFPSPKIYKPIAQHNMTAILLAGRGCLGEELADQFDTGETSDGKVLRDLFPGCKWIFLSGPLRFVEKFGENQPEWFDLDSTMYPHDEEDRQEDGLLESMVYVNRFIKQELLTLPHSRIVVGGQSQGCAFAFHVLLAHCKCERFGAFVGMSGWFPLHDEVEGNAQDDRDPDRDPDHDDRIDEEGGIADLAPLLYLHACDGQWTDWKFPKVETPVLLTHCKDDAIIDVEHGGAAADLLRMLGWAHVQYMELETGGHDDIPCPEVFDKIRDLLSALPDYDRDQYLERVRKEEAGPLAFGEEEICREDMTCRKLL